MNWLFVLAYVVTYFAASGAIGWIVARYHKQDTCLFVAIYLALTATFFAGFGMDTRFVALAGFAVIGAWLAAREIDTGEKR